MLNIAIGFVTGRKHFQSILTTYVNNWLEHGLINDQKIRLHLIVAYDLKYAKTEVSDYKNIKPEVRALIDSISFYGKNTIEDEKQSLINNDLLSRKEADMLFGDGYAKKRNMVVYAAIKKGMDRLIFIDDDEYPLAVMKNNFKNLIWMGQSMVGNHIKYSQDADITHGHHCGYISPIPSIDFNGVLKETDFKMFIEAISNEIISWENVKENIIHNKGVTYADSHVINNQTLTEVNEILGMKFISGANLCFNLKNCRNKIPPFYNPPGARGEDTFMSTALSELKVLKVPIYTFHDGFMKYATIMKGSLPTLLEGVDAKGNKVTTRFLNAAIGWIRYKPLMLYVTQRNEYEHSIAKMQKDLAHVIPKFCEYFETQDFYKIISELQFYHKNVKRHFASFEATKSTWQKLMLQIIDDDVSS